jgi:hypothetical protein
MPTAMLDIAICYLFIAFIDSLFKKQYIYAGIELSFLVWSKPFMVLQVPLLFLTLFLVFLCLRAWKVRPLLTFGYSVSVSLKKKEVFTVLFIFILCSLFIALPFILKSLYYAGTPLFPFIPGLVKPGGIETGTHYWQSIVESANSHLFSSRNYGSGTSFIDFLKHLWILSVPENSVNNRYDYPIGLPYLLFLAPFLYSLVRSFLKKELPLIPVFAVIYWMMWWFGAQQARFFFIPLMLIFITSAAMFRELPKLLAISLLIAILFNAMSIIRFSYKDIKTSRVILKREQVLLPSDRLLLERSRSYIENHESGPIELSDYCIAYAQFPVIVTKKHMPFVLDLVDFNY